MPSSIAQPPSEVLTPPLHDRFIAEWRALCASSKVSYFSTPDWILSWWEHLAERPKTLVAVWRDEDGNPSGVAPMSRVYERVHPRVPVSVPKWINSGSGPGGADHVSFPSVRNHADSIRAWLDLLPGTYVLNNTPPELGVNVENLNLLSTTATYHRTLQDVERPVESRSMGKELRRKRRRLADSGVHIDVVVGRDIDESIVDSLFGLHADRFATLKKASVFHSCRKGQILNLIEVSGPHRGPVAVTARDRDEIIAVDLSLRFGSRVMSYQSGWNPEYEKQSPGLVLLYHSIEWAMENGIEVFDLLRGDAEYKQKVGVTKQVDQTFMRGSGLSGGVLELKNAIKS